jgi:redox-sensitive bicupin YhaK (pirin superfamily)
MILIHDNMSRGRTQKGWLDAFHSFSFGDFLDPTRMGFGALRVLNEDRIIPGAGFAPHDHADMDILTVVLSGEITHEDSLGNTGVTGPGEVQLMSAGRGIRHSERNASADTAAHLLQIWLIPDQAGGEPAYQQAALPPAAEGWTVLASGPGGTAPLRLNSDTRLSITRPREGSRTQVTTGTDRLAFVQIVEGIARIDGERLAAGDGVQVSGGAMPDLVWVTDGQALLFDMAR